MKHTHTFDRMDGAIRKIEVRRLWWGWWINGAWCPTRKLAEQRFQWFQEAPRSLLRRSSEYTEKGR